MPDSRSKERESGQTVYYQPWRVNWFIYRRYVLVLPARRRGLESLTRARLLNSSLTFNVTTQSVTVVDKLINTPRISWQASTKRSIQFDQTLSLLRESLAHPRLGFLFLITLPSQECFLTPFSSRFELHLLQTSWISARLS